MGKKSNKAFENVLTFEDFKDEIEHNLNYLTNGFFNLESLSFAMPGMTSMPDKDRILFLRFMRHVDRKLSFTNAALGNRFHKIPTVMAGFIYLRFFPEQVKDLSLDELTVLSIFSIVEPPSFYEGAVEYLGKGLIAAATAKHFNYSYQSLYLDYGESKIRKGESKENVAAYIKDTPLDILTNEADEWQKEELQKGGLYL